MKASRLLSILMLLQSRGRLSAAALAEALEVSERTILRDIDQLSAAGVPLWAERGRQGGFQLREGWSTELTGMTEPEAHALLLAGLPGPATELGLGAAAASARLKLLASLPAGWREQADQVGERLHIDPVDWYRAADTPRHLREVADAVWHARRLAVDYESWRGPVQRTLEPLGLVLKAGAWYLVAREAPAAGASPKAERLPRTYRLASLLSAQLAGSGFRRPRRFDLAATWRASASRFEAELRPLQAHAQVTARGQAWLRNARLPTTPVGAPQADGAQALLLPIESIEHGARQVLGFAGEMIVLAPPELKAAVHALASALAAQHGAAASTGVAAL